MFQVYYCLADQHDWRLVGVAAVVCLLASFAAINIFNRARANAGGRRVAWIAAAGAAAGFGIWATHFVAMLAYEPGVSLAYGVTLTAVSLAAAAVTVSFALSFGIYVRAPWAAPVSGGLVGGGIATMHYIGMAAVSVPGLIVWRMDLVAASIALGMIFGALAMVVAVRSPTRRDVVLASLLLTLAIVSLHFTAMGAVDLVPDPTRMIDASSVSPAVLAVAVASAAVAILAIALASAFAGQRIDDKNHYLALAINNMTQGVVMFDMSERLVTCNSRYIEMYGLSPDVVKRGASLAEVIRNRGEAGGLNIDLETYRHEILDAMARNRSSERIIETSEGRAISVVNRPVEGGKYWIGTHDDITERIQAERKNAALSEQERRRAEIEREIKGFHENATALLRTVSESTGALKAISVTLSTSSGVTSERAASVAQTSNEASASMSAAATAAEQLIASIAEISRQLGQAAHLVTHSVAEASSADEQMAQLTDTVREIGDVANLIGTIAGQTNLLALNATIEAARAGEAGRGFAVVASEVKLLAVQTAQATEKIAQQIQAVQGSTRFAVDAIRRNTERMKEIDAYTSAVARSLEQQNSATDEISRNLSGAATGAKVIVSVFDEVAKAVGDARGAAGKVLDASQSVEAATTGLRHRIESFLSRVAV
ncbi:MAG TPA: MHYT domain-containing protein [Pseudolabrys sp.]|nr:MHYT domain-containing protein [Pseudolabrys sp.]